ncbi:AlpA family phage regulatory protein [Paraburkholderia sp. RP-4-7]|uniref:AlpA family phage regulatory protein n=1 Tax=Paraburkholderia polaris TaxID=2728848 RepID=A0A848ITL8_9BURK|nr:AlpA family phage regulatory protein [Paraburkholderia polaris]NMM02427.1 AlpA family phage regulatory protein [Paraburkholderia polaris]
MQHPTRSVSAVTVNNVAAEAGKIEHKLLSDSFRKLPPIYQDVIRRHSRRDERSAIDAPKTAEKAGIGVSTLWREVALKRFVPPIRLSERRVAWLAHEVDAILEAKHLMSRVSGQKIDLRDFVSALIEASTHCSDSIG